MNITTEFEIYMNLSSVVIMFYNILMTLIISYIGYRYKPYMAILKILFRNYVAKIIMIKPSLIITTILLLTNIIFILVGDFINKILAIFNLCSIYYLTLISFILIILIVKSSSEMYFIKHANEYEK